MWGYTMEETNKDLHRHIERWDHFIAAINSAELFDLPFSKYSRAKKDVQEIVHALADQLT
jgi:hypothetical protein